MIDWKRAVRTKGDKMPVRILATDAATFDRKPVVGLYDGHVETWTEAGGYCNDPVASGMDLENIPPEPPKMPAARDVLEKIHLIRNVLQFCGGVERNREAEGRGLKLLRELAEMLHLKYQEYGS